MTTVTMTRHPLRMLTAHAAAQRMLTTHAAAQCMPTAYAAT